jgi:hypothetical protein
VRGCVVVAVDTTKASEKHRRHYAASSKKKRAYFSVPKGPTPHRNHHVKHRLLHRRTLPGVWFATRWRHYPDDVSMTSLWPWCC